ncbi:(4Fe-4S)-binding protein [Candidatus Aerophobetes bacterium]|uniref:(4Fe-4S)-binding protein n=1 Tax=Aerophobetes bacterium TaxID=2030807 RepID=A0A497E662_UNCAE|nr:MAG: (4Fe-4S)-binding protein [Candidatus Aerophobetes bacterium]
MVVSVASGKGGTGKTTVAVNLALSLEENVQFLDCDVEEPNAHIFLKPKITHARSLSVLVPKVDEKRCTYCGKCARFCSYNAIAIVKEKVLFFPELCHNCGGCTIVCPEKAIREVKRPKGVIEEGRSGKIRFIKGELNVGEAVSPPLIREVKRAADEDFLTIIDVPPGTSCPVIEAVKESDFCLLVTEPTPFGLNDLILAVEVMRKLKIPFAVVINRSDIGDGKVEEYCEKEKIPILMRIPMDRRIATAYSKGTPIVEEIPEYREKFKELYEKIKQMLSK